jgi:hypothetical protein
MGTDTEGFTPQIEDRGFAPPLTFQDDFSPENPRRKQRKHYDLESFYAFKNKMPTLGYRIV